MNWMSMRYYQSWSGHSWAAQACFEQGSSLSRKLTEWNGGLLDLLITLLNGPMFSSLPWGDQTWNACVFNKLLIKFFCKEETGESLWWRNKSYFIFKLSGHLCSVTDHFTEFFVLTEETWHIPVKQLFLGIADEGNHRLCSRCFWIQHYRKDLAISFIPAGCCFPASPLSLEHFTVSIIRQNKIFWRFS